MEYNDLGLNRLGFKQEQSNNPLDAVEMSNVIDSRVSNNVNEQGTNVPKPIKQIDPGTVITNCMYKTSDGPDRIELGNSLETALGGSSLNPLGTGSVDYLASFNNGILTSLISGQGNVYIGYTQPIMKWINYANGIYTQNRPVWLVVKTGTGEYTVTHNLNTLYYSVSITPVNANFYGSVYSFGKDSFIVRISNATGAAVDSNWNVLVMINPV